MKWGVFVVFLAVACGLLVLVPRPLNTGPNSDWMTGNARKFPHEGGELIDKISKKKWIRKLQHRTMMGNSFSMNKSRCPCITFEVFLSQMFTILKELLGGPVVRTWCFHCQGPGLIFGWGTKIPQAIWHCQKKVMKFTNILVVPIIPIKVPLGGIEITNKLWPWPLRTLKS